LMALYAAGLARAGLPDRARAGQAVARRGGDVSPLEYEVGVLALLGDLAEAVEILRTSPGYHLHSKLLDPLRGYAPFDSLKAATRGEGASPP